MPDDLAVVVGDPRARGIGALQVRDPVAPALAPLLLVDRRDELRRDLGLQRRPCQLRRRR